MHGDDYGFGLALARQSGFSQKQKPITALAALQFQIQAAGDQWSQAQDAVLVHLRRPCELWHGAKMAARATVLPHRGSVRCCIAPTDVASVMVGAGKGRTLGLQV
jgi:hypothetical protein